MNDLLQDIKYAFRTIAKKPGFAAVVIITLALGIGINTTVFISANAVVFRPFPYQDPASVVALNMVDTRDGEGGGPFSYADFHDVRAAATSFTSMAAFDDNSYNMAIDGSEPERVDGAQVSATLFPLLGIDPLLGRHFRADEDVPGAERVVLLSDALWRQKFAADPQVTGRTVVLNGVAHSVIGVMPPQFSFPNTQVLWTTLRLDPSAQRGSHFLSVLARLKPGVTAEGASVELAAITRALEQQYPATNLNFGARAVDFRKQFVDEYSGIIYIMMGAVGFVLLIACANVANLLLARATSRQREVAIRTALGASRGRIIRQLMTESLILAFAGAALGLLVALWGNDLIDKAVPSDRPFWMRFELDWRVLTFTAAVAVATGLLFGLAPALQTSAPDMGETLKEGGQGAGSSRRRGRLRNALVVAEVALSLVLLVGAGLMTRSFLALQDAHPGFERSGLLTVRTFMAGPSYDSTYQRAAFLDDILQRVRAIPGVEQAAFSSQLPLTNSRSVTVIEPEGKSYAAGEYPNINIRATYGDFTKVMRIPVQKGRSIDDRDVRDSTRMVLVNATMAGRVWPGEEVVGKRFKFYGDTNGPFYTVAGVVSDIRARRLNDLPENQVYLTYTDFEFRSMSLLVRAAGDPMALAPAIREAVRERDATLPLFEFSSMDAVFHQSFWEKRLYGWMFASFGAIALLLAAIGLYAVIAYGVAQRTREIGVRMALGAAGGDVVRMVVGRGVKLTGLGLIIGTVAALGLTGLLRGALFGVSARDPLVFVGVAAILATVAVLASALPARRASRVDPIEALRAE